MVCVAFLSGLLAVPGSVSHENGSIEDRCRPRAVGAVCQRRVFNVKLSGGKNIEGPQFMLFSLRIRMSLPYWVYQQHEPRRY